MHCGCGKLNNICCKAAGIVLALALVFCTVFLAAEATHDCAGAKEDCPVCACLAQCRSVLRTMAAAAPAVLFWIAAAAVCRLAVFFAPLLSARTPVEDGIRLND